MKKAEKLMRRDRRRAMTPTVLIYVLSGLVGFVASAVLAELLGDIADAVFSLSKENVLSSLGLIALCIAVNGIAVPMLEVCANAVMLKNALRHDALVLSRWLEKDWLSVVSMDRGEVEDRIEMDPINYRIYWVNTRFRFTVAALTAVPALWLTLSIHPLYGIICILLAGLYLVIPKTASKRQAEFEMQGREYASAYHAREGELIAAPAVLKLLGLDGAWRKMLDGHFTRYYGETLRKKSLFDALYSNGKGLAGTAVNLCVLIAGGIFVARGSISPGGVAAMMSYFSVVVNIAQSVATGIEESAKLRGYGERMYLFYGDHERRSGEEFICRGEGVSIRAEKLEIAYGDETVFSGLSFKADPGQVVAVVGENGSGKSSLIRALTGLISPSEGELTLNGQSVSDLELSSLRRNIAVAMQDPWLWEGSVEENVRLGAPELEQGELDALLEKTGLWAIRDRRISNGEEPLSGGEKQRISIARALARRAPLLILDEPTNHLDRAGIDLVREIAGTYPGTVMVVTHDAELAAYANVTVSL